MQRVVIVGASLAGLRAAQALRKRNFAGSITLIGKEPHLAYDRPPLSKQLLSGEWPADKLFFHKREKHDTLELEQRLGVPARKLDTDRNEVELENGERVPYDGLIIATGARTRQLAAAEGLAGVHCLRTLDDALAIRAALEQRPKLVIIGAGFIGLEVAASARKLGIDVAVVEPQPLPLLGPLGAAAANSVLELHRGHGVAFHLARTVKAVQGAGRVERLILDDGTELPCDLLVVGIGVDPDTDWLQGSGVALEARGGGVICDATLATSVPNIVAAGDVVRWPNAGAQERVTVPHWSNAVEQGNAAATRLLDGAAAAPFAHMPYFWSDQYDRKLQSAGAVRGTDQFELVQGSLEAASFVGLYARDGRLTGALSSNAPAAFLRARKLIAQATPLSEARAAFA
jgi:3-phenylpropionate/trans-cinnamate dioxygenase ferredoxin reductase component